MSMLKITYTIINPLNIGSLNLIQKINNKLLELGYNVTYKDDDTINFNDPFWRLGSSAKAFKKVNGGKFQVITSEKEIQLIFSYYASFNELIFFAILCIIGSIILDYHIIYFLIVLSLIFLLRIDNVKSLGIEMMNSVLATVAH